MTKKYFLKILFFISLSFLSINNSIAAVPQMLHLQAYIVDDNNQPLSDNIALTVRLFDNEFSGNVLFTNDPADRYINVKDGLINYYIKGLNGVDFSKEL